MMALDALCGMVPPERVLMIAKKETAKEAWDTITTLRVSVTPRVSKPHDYVNHMFMRL
jgi:hypothetical protein